jgi:Replication-relaxation
MVRQGLALTDNAAIGLFYIQRYRFLTIDQFSRAASMKRPAASDQLRELERHGILGHFGNIGMPGIDKTPKVYFLKRKGWELLVRESGIPPELIGTHKETHVEARWSPQMFHRVGGDDAGCAQCQSDGSGGGFAPRRCAVRCVTR